MSEASHSLLRLDVERRDRAVVVHLAGSLGMVEAEPLRQQLERLAAEQVPRTVLDLGGLDFIGSAGLAAVVFGHLRNRHHQGVICLAHPRPAVREVLERTRLTCLFPVYESVDQALAH